MTSASGRTKGHGERERRQCGLTVNIDFADTRLSPSKSFVLHIWRQAKMGTKYI